MTERVKRFVDWLRRGVEYLMTVPEANSRFVFLAFGLTGCLSILLLTIGFLGGKGDCSQYSDMVWAVGMVTGSAAFGRWLTKKVGNGASGSNGEAR